MTNDARSSRRRRNQPAAGSSGQPSPQFDTALNLASKMGKAEVRTALGWQIARTLSRILLAGLLSIFAGRLIEDGVFDVTVLAGAAASLLLSGGAGLFADLQAATAEAELGDRLRSALEDALTRMSPARIRTRPAGALVAGLQRHPGALASLTISHTTAKFMLGGGPMLVAAAVAWLSWQAALALLLAIPVMIAGFVMLGRVIGRKAELQEKAFGRLAAQFSDRIRTLPTILANHALRREHGKIEARMNVYAASTMGVLKLAFLNAGVIDLFSALAIALLAVLLGLGHLGLLHVPGFTGLALWQTLFILLSAAEFFAPFRRYAEQYHLKAEGQAAAKELDWFFDQSSTASEGDGSSTPRSFVPCGAFEVMTELPAAGLIAVSGPSGAGKSTLLRMIAGIETPSFEFAALPRITAEGCDWMSTDIYVAAGTLGEAIAWKRGAVERTALYQAAARVGLLDERLLPGGLEAGVVEGGGNLSGGQRMRIGIARILLSSGVVLADEPTAKLDPHTAKLVRQVLAEVARRRLVIVATHDERLIEAASQHHVLRLQAQAQKVIAA